MDQAFEKWQITPEVQHDAGEQVVTVCRRQGRAKESGLPGDMRLVIVRTVPNGLQ
jgi:hypothetical protein